MRSARRGIERSATTHEALRALDGALRGTIGAQFGSRAPVLADGT